MWLSRLNVSLFLNGKKVYNYGMQTVTINYPTGSVKGMIEGMSKIPSKCGGYFGHAYNEEKDEYYAFCTACNQVTYEEA